VKVVKSFDEPEEAEVVRAGAAGPDAGTSDGPNRPPNIGDDPVISLRGVTKRFSGTNTDAVTDLTLDIGAGEIVAFVGPSGCGKTTTLKMINRLIEPTAGSIQVLGQPQGAIPVHELRRQIGFVIQQIGLFPHRTISRNIGVVPELLGWDKRRIAERSAELIELVGLSERVLDRYPPELSGGQQQRVGVARALAADPPILLMDEPYSAVDPLVRERLQDDLLDLQAKVGKTIVVVTHDIEEAMKLGDRVAILNIGGILEQYDTPKELLRSPASEFVASFLGRERGLRQLGLLKVGDVELEPGPVQQGGDSAARALQVAEAHGTTWVAVLEDQELRGWVSTDSLRDLDANATVNDAPLEYFVATVTVDTPLREALDLIVRSRTRRAAVLDNARYLGMVTIDAVAGGLQ